MSFVCTLHGWVYGVHVEEFDVILRVLGVFTSQAEALACAESFPWDGNGHRSDRWIEIHQFQGTDGHFIGQYDNSGFTATDENCLS